MTYPRQTATFEPPYPCPHCGTEVQNVYRSFGRSATEETHSGRRHDCPVVRGKLDELVANLGRQQPPAARPVAPKPKPPTVQPSVQQRTPPVRSQEPKPQTPKRRTIDTSFIKDE